MRKTLETAGRQIRETWDNASHYRREIRRPASELADGANTFEDAGDTIADGFTQQAHVRRAVLLTGSKAHGRTAVGFRRFT